MESNKGIIGIYDVKWNESWLWNGIEFQNPKKVNFKYYNHPQLQSINHTHFSTPNLWMNILDKVSESTKTEWNYKL